MAKGTDAFEERLKRLGTQKPKTQTLPPAKDLNAKLVPPDPERSAGKDTSLTAPLIVAIGVLVFGAGAFGAMLLAPHLIFGHPAAEILPVQSEEEEEDARAPQSIVPPASATPKPVSTASFSAASPVITAIQPTSVQSTEEHVRTVIAEAKRKAQEQARTTLAAVQREPQTESDDDSTLPLAWVYLPQAPGDWIAVTPSDSPTVFGTGKTKAEKAAVAEAHKRDVEAALNRVAGRFPGGRTALEAHPNYPRIKDYLSNQPVSRKFRGRRTNKGNVLYVGPSGSFLKVTLHFLPKTESLGPENDPSTWGAGIVARLDGRFGVKGVHTSFLNFDGGVSYGENTTVKRVKQPSIGMKSVNYDMALALNHRTAIKILGMAPPEKVKQILRSIDPDLLLERVDMMDAPS